MKRASSGFGIVLALAAVRRLAHVAVASRYGTEEVGLTGRARAAAEGGKHQP